MKLEGLKIGMALTGSFCTYKAALEEMKKMVQEGAQLYPIMSYQSQKINSRFGNCNEFKSKIEEICGRSVMDSIEKTEPIGPSGFLDILIIMPCTGNTIAKLANGITDSPVLMAAKAHMRNEKPLVISISTNDALGMNFKTIGQLMNMKNIYFVPFGQDNPKSKPNSMIADLELLPDTIDMALKGKQIQPIIQ